MKKTCNIMNLVLKDLKLSLHPAAVVYFVLAATMMFIPNYPRPIGFCYIIIAVMMMFSTDLQNKDREFTSLLPVRKTDCVKARVVTVCTIELATLIVSIPFAILAQRMFAAKGMVNAGGMSINLTLYAIALIGYSIANLIIIPGGYKKNFKVNARCLIALVVFIIVTVALENIVCRPMDGKLFLNGTSGRELLRQLPVLAGAIVLYVVVNLIVCRIAFKSYEKAEI